MHSVTRDAVNLVTENGERWRVRVTAQTLVEVTGRGGPELLAPGAMARFNAVMTSRNVVVEPIAELTLSAPIPGVEPGVGPPIPPSAAGGNPAAAGGLGPGFGAPLPADGNAGAADGNAGAADGNAGGAEAGRRGLDRPPRGAAPLQGPVRAGDRRRAAEEQGGATQRGVTGVIKSFRRGNLLVDAGRARVRGKVAPDARVEARLGSHVHARPGDAVAVVGTLLSPVRPGGYGEAVAQRVTITLRPAAAETREPRGGEPRGRRGDAAGEPQGG